MKADKSFLLISCDDEKLYWQKDGFQSALKYPKGTPIYSAFEIGSIGDTVVISFPPCMLKDAVKNLPWSL